MAFKNAKKIIIAVAAILAAAFAFSSITQYQFAHDTTIQGAEEFIRNSPTTTDSLGKIKNIKLTKSLEYDGVSDKEEPYRQYSYLVNGDKAQALVVVEAKESNNENLTYRIVKVTQ